MLKSMKALSPTFVLVLASVFCCQLNAVEVYRSDEGGVPSFSDKPMPGAKKIIVRPTTVIQSRPVRSEPSPPTEAEVTNKSVYYDRIAIRSPGHEETLRINDGVVEVAVSLEPGLRTGRGHRLTLLLDGTPVGEPSTATQFTLPSVDRGEHSLTAVVTDAKGEEIARSDASTFFMFRRSILHPTAIRPSLPNASPPPANPSARNVTR